MEAHCLETGYDYSKIIPTLKHHCTNGRLINRLEDRPPSQFTRSFLSIKEKLKRDGLIMAKADKGEALVLMTKDQYEQKLLDFLHQAGASPMDYKFSIHNESIRGKIRKAQFLITGLQKSRERFYVMNPAFSKIYGQVKTHKVDILYVQLWHSSRILPSTWQSSLLIGSGLQATSRRDTLSRAPMS